MNFRIQVRTLLAASLLACFSFALFAQQPSARTTIQGVVRHARTGEPLTGAHVALTSVNAQAGPTFGPRGPASATPIATVTTGANGEFLLADVEPGTFRFSVMNSGFVRYDSGRIDLTAGQTMKDIVVRMIPTGTVSGRVSTGTGRPAVGVTVSLLRRGFSTNGSTSLSSVASAVTNDLGEYRMFWVTPGRYYLVSEQRGRNGGINDERYLFDDNVRRGLNEVSETYAQTFFPGVTDMAKASILDLQEGGELRGVDLTVTPQQRVTIRGRIVDPSTGQPPPKVTVSLTQRSLTGGTSSSFGTGGYNPTTGTFELGGLAPGRYGLSVSLGDYFMQTPPAGTPYSSREILVGDATVEDVVMSVGIPPVITGRIKVEGQLPAGTSLDRLRVSIASPAALLSTSSATADAEGVFKLSSLPEGVARVAMPNLPAGLYLKEARLDGSDVLKAPSRFSVAGNLEVTVSSNTGQVEGRVFDDKMQPRSAIEVILIPNEARDRSELFKRAVTDAEGRFTLAGITPGDYRLFSWEQIEANSYFDPDVLAKYEERGTPVRVGDSSKQTVEVRIIPEGASQ